MTEGSEKRNGEYKGRKKALHPSSKRLKYSVEHALMSFFSRLPRLKHEARNYKTRILTSSNVSYNEILNG